MAWPIRELFLWHSIIRRWRWAPNSLPRLTFLWTKTETKDKLTHSLSPRAARQSHIHWMTVASALSLHTHDSPFPLGLCLQVTPPGYPPGPHLSPHIVPHCDSLHRAITLGHCLLYGGCQSDDYSIKCSPSSRKKEKVMEAGFWWGVVRCNPASHQGKDSRRRPKCGS